MKNSVQKLDTVFQTQTGQFKPYFGGLISIVIDGVNIYFISGKWIYSTNIETGITTATLLVQ